MAGARVSIPAPAPERRHTCRLPYPYLFTDELPGYTPPSEDDDEFAWHMPGRSVSIDNPRFRDGRLNQCPECKTWWVFRTHPTPPGQYGGYVQCVTTYSPAWHRVRWTDFALRRRIREAGLL